MRYYQKFNHSICSFPEGIKFPLNKKRPIKWNGLVDFRITEGQVFVETHDFKKSFGIQKEDRDDLIVIIDYWKLSRSLKDGAKIQESRVNG